MPGNRRRLFRFYAHERPRPLAGQAFHAGAEEPGFRDFPGLLATKENRNSSRQTPLPLPLLPCFS